LSDLFDLMDEGAVVLDGMDEAILGLGWDHAKSIVLFYDRAVIARICVESYGMALTEAETWIRKHIEPLCRCAGSLVLIDGE